MITLASTSPYRRQLLKTAGFDVEVVSPEIDESALKMQIKDPKALARELAQLKARAGQRKTKNPWVVGSDQVAALETQIFDKPLTKENAFKTLLALQGRTHTLLTAVCLITPQGEENWCNETRLTMRPLSEAQIRQYITEDSPLDCAGAYKLEKAGIRLFESIESSDFTAIQGLPMIELCNRLYASGWML
ncbi:MAG: septum formation protein Maf [Bdellovibrionales bacterium]|nr:septum formation protein Maf [Bdellovibrionales bacterium]